MEDKPKSKINFIENIFKKEPSPDKDKIKISSLLDPASIRRYEPTRKAVMDSRGQDISALVKFPFGLDIGSSFIKVSQFARTTASTYQLVDLQIIDVPAQSRDTTVWDRKEIITRLLKDMLSVKEPKEVHLSMPTNLAELKLLRLPPMPYNEINEAVNWELKQVYGDKISDFAIDCLFLGDEEKQNTELEILVVKVAKVDIQEYSSFVKDAGLRPLTLEADPLVITSALTFSGQLKEDVVVILDMGYDHASFNVVYKGKLYFSRNLTTTGSSLTRSIASYCNVDFNTAENLKFSYGMLAAEGENLKVRNAVVPQIENLVSDIEHSFKYFSYQLTQSKISWFDKIIINGGTANLKGLIDFLKNRLGIPVEAANPLQNADIHPDIKRNFNLEKLAPSLTVSIGLGIRQFEAR